MSDRPLEARRILLTRRPEQGSELAGRLRELGAVVLEVPAIEVAPPEDRSGLDRALRQLHRYHWLIFTSANSVRFVHERLRELGLDRDLAGRGVRVGSVGPATSRAFEERFGGTVALEPGADFRAEGLLAALGEVAGEAFLLPVSDRARDLLARTLEARGARVDVVVAYRTVMPPGAREQLEAALGQGVDLATFASPSAVEAVLAAGPERAAGLPAAVIGPVTEAAARAAGMDVVAVAQPSTADGLLAAILRVLGRSDRSAPAI